MNVLITGAYDGFGRKTALRLAKMGYHVYVTTHHELEAMQFYETYHEKYPNIECFALDITKKEDWDKVNKLDIDILISNAAIGEGGSIAEIPMDLVRHNFEVNVFSNFELIQLVLKKMIAKKKGRIILTASILGLMPFSWLGVYSATKASIITLAETLRKELSMLPVDIKVSIIEPGAYHTGFNQLMLDNKYKWMKEKSYFKHQLKAIYRKEHFKFALLEKRNCRSIVSCFVDAATNKHPKAKYRAPFFQVLMMKLYLIFYK